MTIRVLVVDDSSLIRQLLTAGLSEDPAITVVGGAKDPYEARDMIVQLSPDVLTLDVEMPRMDGITFLRKLMQFRPLPVVMISTLTKERAQVTLEAFEIGAVDVVAKPNNNVGKGLTEMMAELRTKVKAAARAKVRPGGSRRTPVGMLSQRTGGWKRKVLALGASTGGTEALHEVLSALPADTPGTVIVQHMPGAFTGAFARRLDAHSAMSVVEAKHGMVVEQGVALLAPGGKQMRVVPRGGKLLVTVNEGPPVQGHAPSVDVLFFSVAEKVGSMAVGAILTGMGADGAEGLLAMRQAGARTVAQDEATSVVYGMPRMATINGGAEAVRPLSQVAPAVVNLLRSGASKAA